ncbi:hypothetical protein F2Q70_00015635 [Brassica cretica]|uniref:Uncharacterized protein n=1 Tax=Brassica cretica TaxID=69181 RepID=A0A8S9HU46_BRACR|nr:hypothetical protein F2Q70_00015635 [Brassica cretica]
MIHEHPLLRSISNRHLNNFTLLRTRLGLAAEGRYVGRVEVEGGVGVVITTRLRFFLIVSLVTAEGGWREYVTVRILAQKFLKESPLRLQPIRETLAVKLLFSFSLFFSLAPSLSLSSLSLPRDALSLPRDALSLPRDALSLLAVARSLSPRRRRVVVVVTGSQSPLPCLLFPDPDPDLG